MKIDTKLENRKLSEIPFWAYTDESVYKKELERLFYNDHWCYVGLEVEVQNPGDFKNTLVGERSVVMVRDDEGSINVVENVCAHKGMKFCREKHGKIKDFICPYHQWSYDLKGNLEGVPLLRGMKKDGKVQGGMPKTFKKSAHGLTKLKVAIRGGAVFASFNHDIESLEDYIGEELLGYYDRVFSGRPLKVLGYNKQRIPGNWKLMLENIKDPYHPGLLHTWFVTFGLWRSDNESELKMDKHFRHAAMITTRGAGGKDDQTTNVSSFKGNMELNDKRFLDVKYEDWWNGPTAVMLTLFPSVIIQQQVNSLSTRHIQPNGKGSFDFVWTHFGFEDDSEEMTERRLIQANLFGPAGFVSADDGEAIEFVQEGCQQKPDDSVAIIKMGGIEIDKHTDHMVSETLIRGMYDYWSKKMEG